MDPNVDIKLAAKELASKLKAKAELLEALDETQLKKLKDDIAKQNDGSGCWAITPCILRECIFVTPA